MDIKDASTADLLDELRSRIISDIKLRSVSITSSKEAPRFPLSDGSADYLSQAKGEKFDK